jgi:hypothetical protein
MTPLPRRSLPRGPYLRPNHTLCRRHLPSLRLQGIIFIPRLLQPARLPPRIFPILPPPNLSIHPETPSVPSLPSPHPTRPSPDSPLPNNPSHTPLLLLLLLPNQAHRPNRRLTFHPFPYPHHQPNANLSPNGSLLPSPPPPPPPLPFFLLPPSTSITRLPTTIRRRRSRPILALNHIKLSHHSFDRHRPTRSFTNRVSTPRARVTPLLRRLVEGTLRRRRQEGKRNATEEAGEIRWALFRLTLPSSREHVVYWMR